LVDDAKADSLLVEVDADKVHGSLLVWKLVESKKRSNAYHEFKALRTGSTSCFIVSPDG
jgi:hypothetical protein